MHLIKQNLLETSKVFLQKTIEEHKQTLDMEKTRDFIDSFIKEINISNGHPTTFTGRPIVSMDEIYIV